MARVLPDVAGFDREFDYLVPAEMAASVRVGSVVRAPLQGRKVRGWVTGFPVDPPPGVVLRPIDKVSGWGPEPQLVDLAAWAAWRWAGRRRSLLVTATAVSNIRQLPTPAVTGTAGRRPSSATPARPRSGGAELVAQSRAVGTHLLRVPPATSATELVLAAAEDGPVLVIAPTTARAGSGCAALRHHGVHVALLPDEWAQARAGAEVVIGARASAWGPCPGLASVVVLDAHDEGLVQEQAPTWAAPAVAAKRARRTEAPCLWVTSCPTLELLERADDLLAVSRSAERAGWAVVRSVDLRQEDPHSGLFSKPLVDALRDRDRRVVCVLNRKGRAVLLDCGACGDVARCEKCGAAVAMAGDDLVCRRCHQVRPVVCLSCGSDALRLLRPGLSRVREQLEALAGRPTGEVAAGSGPLPDTPVLVGTEAVLHRASELRRTGGTGTVVFLDFDQELLAPRYRASEQALALLARASRLLGGRGSGGVLLVQTRLPSHPVITAATLADPARLAAAEEPVRRALRLPPFAALAVIAGPGAGQLAGSLLGLAGRPSHDNGARPGPGIEVKVSGIKVNGIEVNGIEVNQVAEDRWAVRAPTDAALADVLAAAGRPPDRVRVEVGPVRF